MNVLGGGGGISPYQGISEATGQLECYKNKVL